MNVRLMSVSCKGNAAKVSELKRVNAAVSIRTEQNASDLFARMQSLRV